ESSQRESDRVDTGAQVHDSVLTRAIRHRRSHSLNQCIARGFNRHAWEHGPRRILHNPSDRRLRERRNGQDEQSSDDRQTPEHAHMRSLDCAWTVARWTSLWALRRAAGVVSSWVTVPAWQVLSR